MSVTGLGAFPLNSKWVKRKSIYPKICWESTNIQEKTMFEDWFFDFYGILKRWTGTMWVNAKIQTWNGSSFNSKKLKMWDGTEWRDIENTGI